jgi:LPS O-antigen subunit length determinant protein (WzzB/FepE family)
MNPVAFILIVRNLLGLTVSEEPRWVQARADFEEGYKKEIEEPFMAGWRGDPKPIEPIKPKKFGRTFWLVLLIGGIVCLLSLWFMSLLQA